MELKIITFNIRCADDENGHSINERAPRLAEALLPYDADIIGLQEFTPAWETHILRDFGESYEIFNQYRASNNFESTPVLWKKAAFDCLEKRCFWLSDTPEIESQGWDSIGCKRICMMVRLLHKESGKEICFMNTHFGFGDPCQIASAELIYRYSQRAEGLPVMLTGDFNMEPTYPAYATMTSHFTDANAATACDRRDTYHGYFAEGIKRQHIDYCFVNDRVKPRLTEIITKDFKGKYPSDHFGIFFTVEV